MNNIVNSKIESILSTGIRYVVPCAILIPGARGPRVQQPTTSSQQRSNIHTTTVIMKRIFFSQNSVYP